MASPHHLPDELGEAQEHHAAVTIPEAAAALGISQRELKAWIAAGAPVHRRGRRGRGCSTTLIVPALSAWRDAASAASVDASAVALVALAANAPERLATEVWQIWCHEVAPGKGAWWRKLPISQADAAQLHELIYQVALEAVRGLVAEAVGPGRLPPLPAYPDAMARLQKITHS